MSESDSDFEMLEKRLSDLNPDELILVTVQLLFPHLCTEYEAIRPQHAVFCRFPVLSHRCSTCTTYLRISVMHRVKGQLAWERYSSCDNPCHDIGCRQPRRTTLPVQVEMSTRSTNRSFKKLITERDDVSPDDIYQALCNQNVELVFTAHPTQVNQAHINAQYAVLVPTVTILMSMCHVLQKQIHCEPGMAGRSLLAFLQYCLPAAGIAWLASQEVCQDSQ